jgi:hypothetical protein
MKIHDLESMLSRYLDIDVASWQKQNSEVEDWHFDAKAHKKGST